MKSISVLIFIKYYNVMNPLLKEKHRHRENPFSDTVFPAITRIHGKTGLTIPW